MSTKNLKPLDSMFYYKAKCLSWNVLHDLGIMKHAILRFYKAPGATCFALRKMAGMKMQQILWFVDKMTSESLILRFFFFIKGVFHPLILGRPAVKWSGKPAADPKVPGSNPG